MSIYRDMSAKIGYAHRHVTWPSVNECEELYQAVLKEDLEAFEKVFTIFRFAICCKPENIIPAAIITQAQMAAIKIWD